MTSGSVHSHANPSADSFCPYVLLELQYDLLLHSGNPLAAHTYESLEHLHIMLFPEPSTIAWP